MCQQAVEKIVKGIFALYTGEEPVKTHNIALIFNNLCDREEFRKHISYEDFDYTKDSDIDIAVFSPVFENMSRVDGLTFLLMQALGYKIDIQPQPYTMKDYVEHTGLVDAVIVVWTVLMVRKEFSLLRQKLHIIFVPME
jgi:predicted nucleotidyltransferase